MHAMDISQLYQKLIEQIEVLCAYIKELHGDSIVCRAECDECCVNFTIGTGEFTALKKIIQTLPKSSGNKDRGVCFFLTSGLCSIYEHRPVICRTHGLPVRFADENGSISYSSCSKNSDIIMNESNTIDIDSINEKLAILNMLALKENPSLKERYYLYEIFDQTY